MTDLENQIDDLLNAVTLKLPELDAETRGIQLFGAPGLNIFSMLNADERRIARVIADLLNPKGCHGQGHLFLDLFMRAVGLQPPKHDDAIKVTIEDQTSDGRFIDITITSNNVILGIEIKLWAAQLPNQLEAYATELQRRSRGRKWELVFLADQKPEGATEKVIRMPWAMPIPLEDTKLERMACPFLDILKNSLPEVRATRTRAFLEDFLVWISDKFGRYRMIDAKYAPYIDVICDNLHDQKRFRAVALFMLAQNDLKRKIINSIGSAVLDGLKTVAAGFKSVDDREPACLTDGDEWLLYRPEWPKNLQLGLAPYSGNKQRGFGIKAPDGTKDKIKKWGHNVEGDWRGRLDTLFGSDRPNKTEYWPWWDCQQGGWNAEFAGRLLFEAPDGVIAEHPEVKLIVDTLVQLAQKIENELKAHEPSTENGNVRAS